MNIQVAVFCGAANEDSGKLSLLGVFDIICRPSAMRRPAADDVHFVMRNFTGEENGARCRV